MNIQDVKDILQTLQWQMSSKILSFCSEENLLFRLHSGRIVRGHT
jgi:hypothetical protein